MEYCTYKQLLYIGHDITRNLQIKLDPFRPLGSRHIDTLMARFCCGCVGINNFKKINQTNLPNCPHLV